jgi:hypothetical protein
MFCRVRVRQEHIAGEFCVRFGKASIARSAFPALDSALTKVPEPFAGLVLASYVGHIGLVFLARQADNVFASALRLTPRADWRRLSVSADGGVLLGGWVRQGLNLQPTDSKSVALRQFELRTHKGDIQGLASLNVPALFGQRWASKHSHSPFAQIQFPNSFLVNPRSAFHHSLPDCFTGSNGCTSRYAGNYTNNSASENMFKQSASCNLPPLVSVASIADARLFYFVLLVQSLQGVVNVYQDNFGIIFRRGLQNYIPNLDSREALQGISLENFSDPVSESLFFIGRHLRRLDKGFVRIGGKNLNCLYSRIDSLKPSLNLALRVGEFHQFVKEFIEHLLVVRHECEVNTL